MARLAWGCGVILLLMEIGWAVPMLVAGRAAAVESGRRPVVAEPQAPAADPGSAIALPTPARQSGNGAAGGGSEGGAAAVGPGRVAGWAQRLSPRVGIPAVALSAYGSAELALSAERPGCHLSWAALAGIGSVESDHGRYGGAALQVDGTSKPPIIGIPLDGHGVAVVRDTDGGRYDGDPRYDRAVGPMQFLPSTWRRYGADGDGDGVANPFSLNDAALAAGRYLCASGGGDLRTAQAWSAAVLAYNDSGTYLAEVTARGNTYATLSFGH